MARLEIKLRRRHLHHRLDWSPWLDQGLCPTSNYHVRMRAFNNINSDLYQDHGGIIHGARGLNVNIALGRLCYLSGQQTRIRHHRLLECCFNDRFSGILWNRVYNNPRKFRRVTMKESLAIHDIPEPCQIWTRIWTSLGRRVQLPARTSFGRSNH